LRDNPEVSGGRRLCDIAQTPEELDRIMVLELIRDVKAGGASIQVELKIEKGEGLSEVVGLHDYNRVVDGVVSAMNEEDRAALMLNAGENSRDIWQHYLDHSTSGQLDLFHNREFPTKADLYRAMVRETIELMDKIRALSEQVKDSALGAIE